MPVGALGRLTEITHSYLWETSNDLVCAAEGSNIWGYFKGLERVTFGAQSNTYYRIAGLKEESTNRTDIHCYENTFPLAAVSKSLFSDSYLMESSHANVEQSPPTKKGTASGNGPTNKNYHQSEPPKAYSYRDTMAPQLILQCSSSLTSTLYCRLIQRCLLATIKISEEASLPQSSEAGTAISPHLVPTSPFSPSTSIDQPSYPRSSSTSSSSSNDIRCMKWVPGAGAAEMGWSALWGLMSQKMATRLHSEIAGLKDVSSQKSFASTEIQERITFVAILDPLVDILIDTIMLRMRQRYHFIYLKPSSADKPCEESSVNGGCNSQYAKAVQTFIEFSTLLSHAYAEIPKLLLLNASFGVGGMHRKSRSAEKIWSYWKDHYVKNSTECNANPHYNISKSDINNGSQCSSGRLGLVCPFGPRGKHLER